MIFPLRSLQQRHQTTCLRLLTTHLRPHQADIEETMTTIRGKQVVPATNVPPRREATVPLAIGAEGTDSTLRNTFTCSK
jgi:hypothetical protein